MNTLKLRFRVFTFVYSALGGQVGFQPNANKLFNFWTPSTIAAHKRNVVSGRKAAGFRQTNQSTLHSYLRDKVK